MNGKQTNITSTHSTSKYASYYGSIFSRLKQQLERQTDSFGNVQNHTTDFVSSGFLFCQRHKKEKKICFCNVMGS